MFKFLHAADIHLDSPLKQLSKYEGAPIEACRLATRRALVKLVDLAIAERVDFVVIAGDLTDGDWRDYQSALFFGNQMRRLRDLNIKTYLIRGNHDAAGQMNLELTLPDNTVFLSHKGPQTILASDIPLAVHGQGYAIRNVTDNLARNYPKAISERFNLGLLHTCAEVTDGSHERYAPCKLDDLKQKNYQYWALGHIHKRETLHKADPFVAFSGNIQGRHARETGPKGCLIVTVDDLFNVTTETRWLHVMRWEVIGVDLGKAVDFDDALDFVKSALRSSVGTMLDDSAIAFRVELNGSTDAHKSIASRPIPFANEVRQIANELGDGRLWVEKVIVKTKSRRGRAELEAEGPVAELNALIGDYELNPDKFEQFGRAELADILKKIDSKIADESNETGIGTLLRELLPQIGPFLLDRFQAS